MREETLDTRESSVEQNYATHGFFRFYGKLPPLVVKRILQDCSGEPVVDIMCGSGTVLVESLLSNRSCVGLDVNPFCVLVSKVKTSQLDVGTLRDTLSRLVSRLSPVINGLDSQMTLSNYPASKSTDVDDVLESVRGFIPKTPNVRFWFEDRMQLELGMLSSLIHEIKEISIKNFFRLAFASIIRKASKASPRAGKLFRTEKTYESVVSTFYKKSSRMIDGMQELCGLADRSFPVETIVSEARHSPMRLRGIPVIFWHPPYLALYRYSAIYCLEMDWLGFDRKNVRNGEIEESYKSVAESKYHSYLNDLTAVMKEAYSMLEQGGKLVAVIADSSLKGVMMPVVSPFLETARNIGFIAEKKITRKIHFSQAVYHPSSRKHIQRSEDKVLFLRKSR